MEAAAIETNEQLSQLRQCKRGEHTEKFATDCPGRDPWKNATAQPQRCSIELKALTADMAARAASLQTQMESAGAEQLQREAENQEIGTKLIDLEAERNACEARDGLLQVESEQVRSRLAEIDGALRHRASCWSKRATAARNCPLLRQNCSLMPNTWLKLA